MERLITPPAMKTGKPVSRAAGQVTGESVLAPAKINLTLEVLGKRPDGYHELRSLVVPVSLCDTLTFYPTDGCVETSLAVSDVPGATPALIPASEGNLATRAAELLREETGYRGGGQD